MIIVKTLDNKMLQDTVVGMVLSSRRPTLTENSSFIETRRVNNEFRPAEVEVLVTDFEPNDGISDKELGAEYNQYVQSLKKGTKPDMEAFIAGWVKDNGSVKKGTDKKAADDKAAKDAAKKNQQA